MAYLRVIGYKVCANEVAPYATEDVDDGRPEPTQTLLNMSQHKDAEENREEHVDQSVT